ncbi:MAG: Hsp70 family protein [Lachnospiraceae bacterium]|nr:Hsp70 family protein [Lachnospiraceae bacterium]
MGRIVGIDLGTTTSEIAFIQNGKPRIIPISGSNTTPSIVGLDKNMEIIVGKPALNQYVIARDRTVCEVKRKMGTGDYVLMAGKKFSPVEISALILGKLKHEAEEYLQESITEAVITVPANFNDAQRQATKEAGEKAGLIVKHIINEPTAAALAYGVDNLKNEGKLLVYDIGGGTFDVTVLEMIENSLDVMASRGLDRLGGKDFDEKIIEYILSELKDKHGVDLSRDLMALARIREVAIEAKTDLSSAGSTSINLPFIAMKDGDAVNFSTDISREWYERQIADYVRQTMDCVDDALNAAKLGDADIDMVLAVGGSSRTPFIRAELEKRFGKKIVGGINPDEAVALGAAVQAGLLGGEITGNDSIAIFDVCNHSLGIRISRRTPNGRDDGVFSRLILRDTHLPFSYTGMFVTTEDYQTVVDVEIFQGESDRVDNNNQIGHMSVYGIPVNKAGAEKVEITFRYDMSGMLGVSAVIVSTGKETSTSINMLDYDAPKSRTEMIQYEVEQNDYSHDEDIGTTVKLYERYRETLPEKAKKSGDELLMKMKQAVDDNEKDKAVTLGDELTALIFEYIAG